MTHCESKSCFTYLKKIKSVMKKEILELLNTHDETDSKTVLVTSRLKSGTDVLGTNDTNVLIRTCLIT